MALTIPLPRFSYKELVGDIKMNYFSDLINRPPACRVKRNNTGPSIPVSTAFTTISWEAETYDPNEMWVIGNPTVVTIGFAAHYDIFLQLKWPTMGVFSIRGQIVKNPGAVIIGEASGYGATIAAGTTLQVSVPQYPLSIGDTLFFQAQHDDTSARSLSVVNSGTYASVKYYSSGALGT